jgi:hypothetical protein
MGTMGRVKRTEAELVEIQTTLQAAASAKKGWTRVKPGEAIREQNRTSAAAEIIEMFGPMVDQIVEYGDWVQYIVKSEIAAKALVNAIGNAARAKGHGMRAELAPELDDDGKETGRFVTQFKATVLRPRKSREQREAEAKAAAEGDGQAPAEAAAATG